MAKIDLTLFKPTYKGAWDPSVVYAVNDVVSYRGSSYICTQAIPAQYNISGSNATSTNFYRGDNFNLTLVTHDPFDSQYWQQFARGATYQHQWRPYIRYDKGDVVAYGNDMYVCTQAGKNIWPLDTNFWTPILRTSKQHTLHAVQSFNSAPLGWQRNLGDMCTQDSATYRLCSYISADGNPYTMGSYPNYNTAGFGENFQYNGWSKTMTGGFTFPGFMSGTLPTPDGETPKCIQIVSRWSSAWFLFNNGELFSVGINGYGQLGQGNTSNYNRTQRVANTVTTDAIGNTIPKTFNQSKIVKIDVPSKTHTSDVLYCLALDDGGGVWSWGYNGYGQLAIGGNDNTGNGQATTNQSRPVKIPQEFFDGKRIVDIHAAGGDSGHSYFIDEDEGIWFAGRSYRGEGGSADLDRQYPVPIKLGNFKLFGGIKKFLYIGDDNDTSYPGILVLDGNGDLWGAGYFWNANTGSPMTNDSRSLPAFRKFNWTWLNDHKIDNVWVTGAGADPTFYLREKGTGLTWAWCSNEYRQQGDGSNHNYNSQSGGQSGTPTLVKRVKNVVQVQNFQSGYQDANNQDTIAMLDEQGRAWGMGQNGYGSLSQGWTGNTWETWQQVIPTGPYQFQPIKTFGGVKIRDIKGWVFWYANNFSQDNGLYILDSGQAAITGADGNHADGTNGGYWITQGHIASWMYRITYGGVNCQAYRSMMHTYVAG
jgi:alpha-tubulin suppressor-like RCC1 family protein